jgi:hypothetical protein
LCFKDAHEVITPLHVTINRTILVGSDSWQRTHPHMDTLLCFTPKYKPVAPDFVLNKTKKMLLYLHRCSRIKGAVLLQIYKSV